MNIKEAKQEIKDTVHAYLQKDDRGEYRIPLIRQRPVLLMGPPGIGKTQIMEQIARECEIALVAYTITHHTRQSAVGLPMIREEEFGEKACFVTEYTMSEIIASIYTRMRETGLTEGILFIDEINCVSETLAPTMLQFLQCKTFGNQAVPEGWIIVAAGNPPEYNKSVREFDMVTLDRVRRIDVDADYAAWKEYARAEGIYPALLSYLEIRPENFYRVETDVDGLRFVTARGWEDLGALLDTYDALHIPVTEEIVYEFLRHEEVAEDVAAYLDLYRKYQDDYSIPDILQGKVRKEIYQRLLQAPFDERFSVVQLLLDGLFKQLRSLQEQKDLTDLWYAFLKEYRGQVESAQDTAACYEELLLVRRQEFQDRKNAGFYTRREKQNWQRLLESLKQCRPSAGEAKESFLQAKEGFDQQRRLLDETKKKAGQMLEHGFDFMEEAFAQGQEMILFVTELTMSEAAVSFLSSYSCERYQRYSRELLVGTRRRELLSELENREKPAL
ncbi:MAG: AAA family ATPase [Clostridiaceae bacterium]|nr:AAA family ATPase [Clostridiaceae bacterium]